MKNQFFAIIILTFSLFSCGDSASVNSPEVLKAVQSRKIRKITEVEILSKAENIGSYLANESQKILGSNLKKQITNNGLDSAIFFCNSNAYSLVDSLEKSYNAKITRVSLQNRNPKNKPTELEKSILDAYQYNIENNLELSSNIQMDGNSILYTQPISITNGLCLNCHGEVGKEITKNHYNLIKELYPEDDATNHKIGDLRGMWSIKLDKAEIIKNL